MSVFTSSLRQLISPLLLIIAPLAIALPAKASSVRLDTLNSSTTKTTNLDLNLNQAKYDKRGRWAGSIGIGSTKTEATQSSPEAKTVDLNESIDFLTAKDWGLGLDGKQSHETSGLSVSEFGMFAQKKIYYTRPLKNKRTKSADDDEPFYPSFAMKLRLGSGSTTEGTSVKRNKTGASVPKLLGFRERNESLSGTWSFLEDWTVGLSFTQYQYFGFDKTQAFLYAHPGIAARLTGATSSVSSVVDHETSLYVGWYFANDWDINIRESLQTDYVTHDTGTTTQVEVTWAFNKDWDFSLVANTQKVTAQPATPVINPSGTSASTDNFLGVGAAYNFD